MSSLQEIRVRHYVVRMAERTPLSEYYRESRERLSSFVREHLDADSTPVPATPGWTVHDVIAHLTGVAEDLAGGWKPTGGPTPEWTAGHVARGAGIPTPELLDKWSALSPAVEKLVDNGIWPVVMDVVSHEHDVRAALGDASGRDDEFIAVAAKVLLRTLGPSKPLLVETERHQIRVGPEEGEPITLRTTSWEAFRWRLGRRSPEQLAAMDWSADPTPVLHELCIFGPAPADVIE
jgi:uncharacterized protein (TIGR03083 family)